MLMLNERKKSSQDMDSTNKNSMNTTFKSAAGTVNTKTTKDKAPEPDSNNISYSLNDIGYKEALRKLRERKSDIVGFIKYDSALTKYKQIDMAKFSSIANPQDLKIKPGVIMRLFAPDHKRSTSVLNK